MVGAYLTAVEQTEEQLLAETTARALEGAGQEQPEGLDGREGTHQSDPSSNMFRATEGRWGSREVEIAEVTLLDHAGQPSFVFHSGDAVSIRLKVRAAQPTDDFVFGVGLFNVDGSAATAPIRISKR